MSQLGDADIPSAALQSQSYLTPTTAGPFSTSGQQEQDEGEAMHDTADQRGQSCLKSQVCSEELMLRTTTYDMLTSSNCQ